MKLKLPMSWTGFIFTMFFALLPFRGITQEECSTYKNPKWSTKMREIEKVLGSLLLDLNSDERYNNPKNFKKIERSAQQLADHAHDLSSKKMVFPDGDPTLPWIAGQFSSEADFAVKSMKWGNRAYSRDVLKSVTRFCVACHTRNSDGPSLVSLTAPSGFESLRTLERGNFYTAIRQFDRALDEYQKLISEPRATENYLYDWEKAARSSLALVIRVKKNPDRALVIVEKVLANTKAPFFFKEQALQWKESLKSWKNEPSEKPMTEEGYFALAIKLMSQAKEIQKYPYDRSADVLYLRASAVLHDLLALYPKSLRSAEALYFLGLCYEVLRDVNLNEGNEFYYLACIHNSPHSDRSRECFKHYEQSVYLGFSGSGGTDIPNEVRKKLNELDALSKKQKEEK
ncbi:MAG: hypothetical protein KA715_09315 [Xanthomonadaceae bacterium]|nr:hypothetical protein [Xanthomonadaceae bacterium]